MSKITKLSHKSLESLIEKIIKEENVQFGDEHDLEPHGSTTDSLGVSTKVDDLLDGVHAEWAEHYNDSDPVMASQGHEAWGLQMELAVQELASRIYQSIEDVENMLHNGEFYNKK